MQKLQELKFYCPLTIRREPDYDEEYDYSEEYPEISPFAVAGYADTVQKRLETYCSDDGKRGLMEYYDRDKSVSEKVYSAVPSVTVRDGELVGMYTCQIHGDNVVKKVNIITFRFNKGGKITAAKPDNIPLLSQRIARSRIIPLCKGNFLPCQHPPVKIPGFSFVIGMHQSDMPEI